MNTPSTCPHCGAALADDQPCPRCELALALALELAAPEQRGLELQSNAPLKRFGHYELLEEIGHGGMGVVYRARDTKLNRCVALKLLLLGQFSSEQAVKRFQREAQAAAALRHPNIVGVLEIGEIDGQHFFTMEWVEGRSLASLLRDGPLAPRQAAEHCGAIARAMHAAHAAGILHRDLKPANVLIDPFEQPRITDFGLAKRLDGSGDITLTGQVLGSPNYLAPELAAGRENQAGPAADIFSMGALLYECLTGRPPFLAPTLQETLLRIRDTEPVAPRLLNSKLPRDLETICLKCLEKEPVQRYATAGELAEELERFLAAEPIQARPIGPTARLWRWCQRKPALAASLFLILILLLIVIIGSPIAVYRIDQARKIETRLREDAQAQAYTSDMQSVLQAWEAGNLKRAQELLEWHIPKPDEPDLRGFEWRFLWQLCRDESVHTEKLPADDPVRRLATSPAHSFVVAACEKSIRLLDPRAGRELSRFPYLNSGATNAWHALALASRATNLLAAHRAEGVVGLWDLANAEPPRTFKAFTNNVGALALSPDGRFLAAADRTLFYGTAISFWDISSSPQSPRLVWSNITTNPIGALAFSLDGRCLVAAGASPTENLIRVLDAASGGELQPVPDTSAGMIHAIAFSPDGALLAASGNDSRINVWDFARRTLKTYLDGHLSAVTSLGFSPDGSKLLSGAWDGTIRGWELASNQAAGIWRDQSGRALHVAFAPDGKSILSATRDAVKAWNPEPREPATIIETQRGWPWPIISPDGKWMIISSVTNASGTRVAGAWDLASGRLHFVLPTQGKSPFGMAFSPDDRFFALGDLDKDGIVAIWEWKTWGNAAAEPRPVAYLTNRFEAGSVAFSPDGKILAVAGLSFPPHDPVVPSGATNRLAFWEIGTWKKLDLLPEAGLGSTEWAAAGSVAFSHHGRWVAIGHRDGRVRLWDFNQQRFLKEFNFDLHTTDGWSADVRFSFDDRWLACYVIGGSSVVLFDLANLQRPPISLVRDNPSGVYKAEFAPDNRTLVTGHHNGQIKFWNLHSFAEALTLPNGHGPGAFPAFSRDGNLLASKTAQGTVRLWRAAPISEIPKFKNQADKTGAE